MRISVILALYNGRNFIKDQLDSILSQSLRPDEIVIVEDAPHDSCSDIINTYIRKNREILFFKNKSNLGVAETFRIAASKATGDIIFLSDQDDIWEKNKIEIMIDVFINKDINLVACGYTLINKEGKYLHRTKRLPKKSSHVKFEKIIRGNIFPGCTMAFNNKIKKKILEMPSNCYIHDWYIAIIGAKGKKFYFLQDKLVNYRIHNGNTIGINTSLRPSFSKEIRIKNIKERIILLKIISKKIKCEQYKNKINKIIVFYNTRISYLIKKDIFMYLVYGAKNISNYSSIRAFFGDIYIIIKEKLHI